MEKYSYLIPSPMGLEWGRILPSSFLGSFTAEHSPWMNLASYLFTIQAERLTGIESSRDLTKKGTVTRRLHLGEELTDLTAKFRCIIHTRGRRNRITE
jgi:hypothetical protein